MSLVVPLNPDKVLIKGLVTSKGMFSVVCQINNSVVFLNEKLADVKTIIVTSLSF